MNYLKQLPMSIGVLALGSGSLYAAQNPGFDIVNKYKNPIFVTLKNGNDILLDKAEIAVAVGDTEGKLKEWSEVSKSYIKAQFQGLQIGSVKIDIAAPTTLTIYRSASDKDPIVHTFTKNKNIYVTFDGKLRPQTGRLGGWLGYTRKGYTLDNNVKAEDIKGSTSTEAEEKKAATTELKDPATESKSSYTRQEWIDWYVSGGYTPDQYEKWLVGVKAE